MTPPLRPDPTLTPGATDPAVTEADILSTICQAGYTRKVRNVSAFTKLRVFARYHLLPVPGKYEIDHLVPLEVGGSNAITNLWPQAYANVPGARDKDALENALRAEVCYGTHMTLADAQTAIASDWIALWQRLVVGPPKPSAKPKGGTT